MSSKVLCIYHSNCADGFMSAWIVRKALGDGVEFHAGVYQDPPPDVTGRDVIMTDFSYKAPVIHELAAKARTLLILDHHKTAAEDLKSLPPPPTGPYDPDGMSSWQEECGAPAALHALFDMERSGAGLTWDYFNPGIPRPKLVNHVEDRDLWRFKLDGTREIQAALFSYPYDFTTWSALVASVEADADRLICEGAAIERKHHKDITELTKVVTRPMRFRYQADYSGSIVVPMANLPYTLTSDAGHLLCGDAHPFAGCYWDTPDGRVFSLRSRDNGADVGEIAKQYGGGGHKHASGFRVPFDQLAQFEP
jgi:hypothetical protein